MSNPTNTVEFPQDARAAVPAPLAATRPFYWSVRRELWENRFLYIAPLIVTAVVLFSCLIMAFSYPMRAQSAAKAGPGKPRPSVAAPFKMAPAPIMFATLLVGMYYCLDALYGERRDRSILFWKSLPVSDRTTVLAKVSIPMVVLPLLAYTLSVLVQLLLLWVTTMVLAGNGMSPGPFLADAGFIPGLLIMFYGLSVHALWFAPIYGWFLLISSWAKRAPFLWAILPPLLVSGFERMTFSSMYFMNMLQYRVTGAMKEAFILKKKNADGGDIDRLSQLSPGNFLSAPGLWVGLIFAALCVAAAIRMRRAREPI